MKKKNNRLIILALGILGLVVITLGITYAFFSYTKEGTTDNTVTTGSITFLYTEVSGVGKGISIKDAFPISDSVGKVQTGEGKVFDFKVTSNTMNKIAIPYEITARKKSTSTLDEKAVKLYLTKVNGTSEEVVLLDNYSNLGQTNRVVENKYIEKTIYNGKVPANTKNYEQDFRLRMWIDESTNFSPVKDEETGLDVYPYNGKEFTVTVNVYANGKKVTDEEIVLESNANISSISVDDKLLTGVEGQAYNYEMSLDKDTTSTTIEVETANPNAKVDIEKVDSLVYSNSKIKRLSTTKTVDLVNGENYFKVTVTSENKKETRDYILKIKVGKESINTLDSLSITNCTLSPVFDSNTTNYTCTVPYNITSVTVDAKTTSSLATTKITGNTNLSLGSNTVSIIVTAEEGTTKTYTVIATRQEYKEALLNGADPVLSNNLVPVTIQNDGTVKKADLGTEWYDYETKQWANAVVLKSTKTYANGTTIPESNIESYFVWIPKYSYQLWDLGNYSSVTSVNTSKVHAIPIKFGLTNTSDSKIGECTTPGTAGSSGNCNVGEYMTHPAFLAFDTNGFWVGKFETGYNGATSTTEAEVDSSDSSKIIIKPNVYSWRNSKLGNMFKASFDYLRNDESHMMKNTEYGAVAYLQHSAYGSATSLRINNNKAHITGYTATVEPTKGYNGGTSIEGNRVESTSLGVDGTYTVNYLNNSSVVASTTGNYTGIYDISGGAWEYVMGYTTKASTTGGSSGITSLYNTFFTDLSYEKYYDKYSTTTNTNYNNRILGDATGEIGPFESENDPDGTARNKSSWYGDFAYFLSSSRPWFYRGGYWLGGTHAGAFAFHATTGVAVTYISFRVVLAPKGGSN